MGIETTCANCNAVIEIEQGTKDNLCVACILTFKKEQREERQLRRSTEDEEEF